MRVFRIGMGFGIGFIGLDVGVVDFLVLLVLVGADAFAFCVAH